MSLPAFSVKHSVLANMMTVFVLVAGSYVALNHLNREVFPRTDLNLVVIRTTYPDASASEVEDLITNPLEEAIREVEDIDEYASRSLEGISYIVVKIALEARNPDRVINDIQRKVDQVRGLPADADDPIVEALTTAQPILNVCVSGDVDEAVLRGYADQLKRRLERINGVASVVRTGWRDEEFSVSLDPGRLAALEVSFDEVVAALARRNINLPGGKIPEGERELLVRTIGKFHDAERISGVVVRANPDGRRLLVQDVGEVRRQFAEESSFARADGQRSIILGVKNRENADVISIVDAARALVEAEREIRPAGVEVVLVDDASYYVKRRLSVLLTNGWVGMVLVTVFLFVFLNARVAIFTAFGIPFAFLTTLLAMSYFGMTINLMTMFGLIIVLGMVVDDAIIVGENVARHLERGDDPVSAAANGATEVMTPVVSTVLTSIAAFIPLIFAPDLYGTYLSWLVYVVVLALAASLLECLVILPAHLAGSMVRLERGGGHYHERQHRIMKRLQALYAVTMGPILRRRYLFLLVTALFFGGLVTFSVRNLKIDIFPEDMIDIFFVRIQATQGSTLGHTDQLAEAVLERIRQLPAEELQHVVTHVGRHISFDNTGQNTGSHLAQLIVYLTPQETRERLTARIMDQIRRETASIPGMARIEIESVKPGPPAGRPLEVKITGPDLAVSARIAEEIKAFLGGLSGVEDIQDDLDEGKEEIQVVVDEEEAARLGLRVDQIAETVFAAFRGAEATLVREGREELAVRVRLPEELRTRERLQALSVRNDYGRLIDLHRVARFEEQRGIPAIFHYNGDRVVTVSASLNTEITNSTEVNLALETAFRDLGARYPGYALIPSGEWKETRKIIEFMKVAFVVASLLIYSIMVVQFSSFTQPLYVMVSIPLGLIGVAIALVLHGKPVSMMALMGVVGLGGVVVNDAIVLVTFINNRIKAGQSVFDAVLDGGLTRLRPILMTSVTTIAGLMPTIYGWGGYEPFIVPAAIALAYGLLFATFLTLGVVPVLYLVGDDVKRLFGRGIRQAPVRNVNGAGHP
ncbi:MAG TPA: efflux RND transporter permease subunit [Kiritimatiellia bacterium]|nr:efflux RND transporter permease subunit [Kiritimatiellia bacterium]HMO98467.1 efflux RND transporter permease subunit [Kiritimatiellia bacterium]HMP96521.1 efflux RND transporter permease subunit [Kiritimatiellia bacterium]